MMNIAQIKAAVDAGQSVRWSNDGYHVTRDTLGQYLITFQAKFRPLCRSAQK
jgi:hypothetical protein